MLLQFRIKNVKSFYEEAILDFAASGISEHSNHIHDIHGNNVLPIIAIYGANAAGKTNLLSALTDMCYFIKTSLEDVDNEKQVHFYSASAFFAEEVQPAEFEATISIDKDYRYGYSLNFEGVIETEYLEYRKTTGGAFFRIFEREHNQPTKITNSDIMSYEERKIVKSVSSLIGEKELLLTMLGSRRSTSYSETLARYLKLYNWFANVIECPECSNKKMDLLKVLENSQLARMFIRNEAIDEYLQFVQKADPTIKGISLKDDGSKDADNQLRHHIYIERESSESKANSIELPTIFESSGTIYILRAYPIIKQALDTGRLLIADEIDRSLHPALLLDIVNLFTNPETNPNNAQLLCSMHNVIIMDKRFLRRDEIWFVEKDINGSSSLYSLADFKVNDSSVRNDADFCKNYILGMYGAVPAKLKGN